MNPKILLIIALSLIAAGLLIYFAMPSPQFRVEVCKEFKGQQSCRTASAETEAMALRTASDNACALISGGVTDSIACQQSEPKSVKWLKRP